MASDPEVILVKEYTLPAYTLQLLVAENVKTLEHQLMKYEWERMNETYAIHVKENLTILQGLVTYTALNLDQDFWPKLLNRFDGELPIDFTDNLVHKAQQMQSCNLKYCMSHQIFKATIYQSLHQLKRHRLTVVRGNSLWEIESEIHNIELQMYRLYQLSLLGKPITALLNSKLLLLVRPIYDYHQTMRDVVEYCIPTNGSKLNWCDISTPFNVQLNLYNFIGCMEAEVSRFCGNRMYYIHVLISLGKHLDYMVDYQTAYKLVQGITFADPYYCAAYSKEIFTAILKKFVPSIHTISVRSNARSKRCRKTHLNNVSSESQKCSELTREGLEKIFEEFRPHYSEVNPTSIRSSISCIIIKKYEDIQSNSNNLAHESAYNKVKRTHSMTEYIRENCVSVPLENVSTASTTLTQTCIEIGEPNTLENRQKESVATSVQWDDGTLNSNELAAFFMPGPQPIHASSAYPGFQSEQKETTGTTMSCTLPPFSTLRQISTTCTSNYFDEQTLEPFEVSQSTGYAIYMPETTETNTSTEEDDFKENILGILNDIEYDTLFLC